MRVLWVSMNAALYDATKGDGYGGIGWIGALFNQLRKYNANLDLGVVFLSNSSFKDVINDVTFYGIKSNSPQGINKWLYYKKGYKKLHHLDYYNEIEEVIKDFNPSLVHLWGVENRLASVCHYKGMPVIAHLQGILSLSIYIYYPYGMNPHTFRFDRFSKREWILNNGFIFGEDEMRVRAAIEKKHLKVVPAVMGRTEWDKDVAFFNNPDVRYFHVDEVLREPFYKSKSWSKVRGKKFIIYSTISDTIYKGLDVILKSAAILKEYSYFDFEWRVAGIAPNSEFVRWFERIVKLKPNDTNIVLLGRQSPEQLINGLLESDIYVHPSYIDNSPNSLCEAQYLGVPCCATNVGGVSSLIKDKHSGRLFPANAPYDMAFAIKDCYDNESTWRTYAENGQAEAKIRHNPQRVIEQLLFAYNEMTK